MATERYAAIVVPWQQRTALADGYILPMTVTATLFGTAPTARVNWRSWIQRRL